MAHYESDPQPAPLFGKQPFEVEYFDSVQTYYRLSVNAEALEGFNADIVSKEVVAEVVLQTLNGMKDHGAAGLNLDIDSINGIASAGGKVFAAMDVGANILNTIAPRVDGIDWHDWLKTEFPNSIAVIYGEDSSPSQYAREMMS